MKKLLSLFAACTILASCSTAPTLEQKVLNVILVNELETSVKIVSIEKEFKNRYCYPFVLYKGYRDTDYSQTDEMKEKVYSRFKEDSIAGYPASENGLPSCLVRYEVGGKEKSAIFYFSDGELVTATTINFYRNCH